MSALPGPNPPSGAPSATASGTGWPKRGEIPSTWSKPAEGVSTLPSRAKSTSVAGPVLGVIIALGTAAVVYVAVPSGDGIDRRPRSDVSPSSAQPAVATAAIPPPPPTSSTTPTAVAPEDQGGDLVSPSTPTAATAAASATNASATNASATTPTNASATNASATNATATATNASATNASATPTATNASATNASATNASATSTNASATDGSTTAASATNASGSKTAPNASAMTSTTAATAKALGKLPDASASDPPVEAGGITELPARKKAKALTARAIASLRDGDVSGAEPALVRAVLIDPSHADAWRHLGIARAQLGDLDGARRAYRKYLELAPKAPDAAQVRAILAQ